MALYSVETRITPTDAIRNAVAYFGSGGLGLLVTQQDGACARFEGGGGHINVTATAGTRTIVELETREWDYHVRQFMRDISRL